MLSNEWKLKNVSSGTLGNPAHLAHRRSCRRRSFSSSNVPAPSLYPSSPTLPFSIPIDLASNCPVPINRVMALGSHHLSPSSGPLKSFRSKLHRSTPHHSRPFFYDCPVLFYSKCCNLEVAEMNWRSDGFQNWQTAYSSIVTRVAQEF